MPQSLACNADRGFCGPTEILPMKPHKRSHPCTSVSSVSLPTKTASWLLLVWGIVQERWKTSAVGQSTTGLLEKPYVMPRQGTWRRTTCCLLIQFGFRWRVCLTKEMKWKPDHAETELASEEEPQVASQREHQTQYPLRDRIQPPDRLGW